ncbi:hypothetical protein EVAR_55019_1 [Eumeta japonica]|uniref:DUF5641 domain-containing protein n=1 Tax=Eumeta variegata TaxID=151549 RepID=A0A4C1YD22_EUMVA|nr:hypothetical protein EVAR_55019_1 [Eumeta japonica]
MTTNVGYLQRHERIHHLKQHFWNRFSTKYSTLLQQRHKWKKSSDHFQVGTLVVIKDKALPHLLWHLGRIVNVLFRERWRHTCCRYQDEEGCNTKSVQQYQPFT